MEQPGECVCGGLVARLQVNAGPSGPAVNL